MGKRVRITEYLDLDLEADEWCCNNCGHILGPAEESYKKGCLIYDRNPHEVHFPIGPSKEFNFSIDPDWIRIVEFYCPNCAVMVENEYLPPGHPLTWDIQLDLDKLKKKHGVKTKKARPRKAPAKAASSAKARTKPPAKARTKPPAAKGRKA